MCREKLARLSEIDSNPNSCQFGRGIHLAHIFFSGHACIHYTPFMFFTDYAVDVDKDKPCFTLVLLHFSGLHHEKRGQINGLMSSV
jgi:hypothetical protein